MFAALLRSLRHLRNIYMKKEHKSKKRRRKLNEIKQNKIITTKNKHNKEKQINKAFKAKYEIVQNKCDEIAAEYLSTSCAAVTALDIETGTRGYLKRQL